MAIDLKSAKDLFVWNKRVLSIGGMWPLEPTYMKFYVNYIYIAIHMSLAITDLIGVFGDMQLMIANLLDTSWLTMFIIKMMVLRHSGKLVSVLRFVEEGADEKNYRDEAEKKCYLAHNLIGKRFFKCGHYIAIATGAVYYFTPMKDFVIAAIHNETLTYILPFKTHLLFDIEDTRIYVLMYIWQLPMSYYAYCYAMTVCFFCTLIVHVNGEMSVLAHRIRLIGATSDLSNDYCHPENAFHDIVTKHLEIIRNVAAIDNIFNVVLLEELLISTLLIALVAYSIITTPPSLFAILFLGNYCIGLLIFILVYCITGDDLIHESANIYEAYYECQWYDMKPKHKKNLIICMVRAKQPLCLTAGKFYIFSRPRFSEILKTAMAYISMLRTVQ